MSHVPSSASGRLTVRGCVRLAISASLVLAAASPAWAQAPADSEELESVIITGSRLQQSGFTTPTPVTVLGADAIEELGITNIGQGANTLPAFRATTTPTTNGWGSFNVGAQIVNLRGLGVSRNLVLVDGRRFAPVTREGTVDLNLVPSGLVERLDVVTGGASAAYGSDAVAGAVNVILNKNLTGLKAQLDFGSSMDGDGDNWHASLAGGAPFADGRGHYILGGEYAVQDGIGDCFTRSYCQPGVVVNNAGGFPNNGLPNFYRLGNSGGFIANSRGVLTGPPAFANLFGTGAISFDAAGNPIPMRLVQPAAGLTAAGGDTTPTFTTAQLEVPVERYTGYGHAYFDFTDDVQGFIEGSYGHVDGTVLQTPYFGAPVLIYNDNPYVPAALRALLPPVSATPSGTRPAAPAFALSVLGQRRGASSSKADSWRATTGLKGKFNETWSWDAYYQYAHTDRHQLVRDNLVTGASRVINRPGSGGVNNPASFAYWSWATDAVYDPADAALPVAQRRITCRALISPDPALRAAAAGCSPFNPFGDNASIAALDYVYQTLSEEIDISQHVLAANVQGSFGELWAGPLSTAAGVEFRRDSTDIVHDTISNVFAYFQNFGADYNADQKVVEGYVEAELPLLKDAPLARTLSLNAAARRTHYDIEGFGSFNQAAADTSIDATTWKVGLSWEPLDWVRVRATQSRDIRAPNFNDLFQASASTFGNVPNRFRAGSPGEFPVQLGGGNPTLDAEKGHTTTVGIVVQPPFAEGLSFSVDYYHIKVNDYIASPGGAGNIVDRCYFDSNPVACSLITFGPGQTLSEIRNVNVNLEWLRTSGLDIEAAYKLPLSTFSSLPGALNFRLLATRTYETSTNVLGVVIDRAGETGGLGGAPTWLANLYTGYTGGPFSLTLSTRYIAKGTYNAQYLDPSNAGYNPANANTINDNHVGGAVYFNVNSSFNFGTDDRFQLFGQVNNIFDRKPPSAPQLQYPSNPVYFDLVGTTYRVGIRARL